MFIYSLHRIVGINKLHDVDNDGRFGVIREYKNHIKFYIIISFGLLCWAAWMCGWSVIGKLALAGMVSLAYVIPLFRKGKRLRDYNYIKIILIAIVWAYVSILPLQGHIPITHLLLLFLERFIFVFTITLPFDVRDFGIDKLSNLITIPKILGEGNTYKLCTVLILIGATLLFSVHHSSEEAYYSGLPIFLIYFITDRVIQKTKGKQSDLFFSGWLDGTLVMRGILIWWLCG